MPLAAAELRWGRRAANSTCAGVRVGLADRMSAARPATWAVAMDAPGPGFDRYGTAYSKDGVVGTPHFDANFLA